MAFLHHLFEACHQLRMRLRERLVVIEDRLDVGHRKDAEDCDGNGEDPEEQPPSPRQLANHPEQQHQQKTADDPLEQECFAHIAEPARPALHGQPVLQRKVVRVEVERKLQQCRHYEKEQQIHIPLHPAIASCADRAIAHPCNHAQPEQQHNLNDAPDLIGEVHRDMHAGEMLCPGEFGGWQRVVGQIAVCRRCGDFTGCVFIGRTLGCRLARAACDQQRAHEANHQQPASQQHATPSTAIRCNCSNRAPSLPHLFVACKAFVLTPASCPVEYT